MLITLSGGDELLLLRALLRASDYGVLLSDAEGRDLVCNRQFCLLFGLDEQDVIDAPLGHLRSLVLPRLKHPDEFAALLDAVYADQNLVRQDEVEILAPKSRVLRRYTAPVCGPDGRLIGRVWTFFDITQTLKLQRRIETQAEQLRIQSRQLATALKTVSNRLYRVENTLNLTQQQLFESEKLSAVGLLAASVAHDIRNILTPINIELTMADADDPAERGASLRTVQEQVDRLSLLTQRLLALSKPTIQQLAPLDLGVLTERVISQVRPEALLDKIEVALRVPRALPTVSVDSVQIERVLVNLILNGVQAMERNGGKLTVRLRGQSRAGVRGVALNVEDTGPGMLLSVRQHLFDPFFTTKPDGTGLGLFSCRRIVEAHHGSIKIKSRIESGTRARLWLPCAANEDRGEEHGG